MYVLASMLQDLKAAQQQPRCHSVPSVLLAQAAIAETIEPHGERDRAEQHEGEHDDTGWFVKAPGCSLGGRHRHWTTRSGSHFGLGGGGEEA